MKNDLSALKETMMNVAAERTPVVDESTKEEGEQLELDVPDLIESEPVETEVVDEVDDSVDAGTEIVDETPDNSEEAPYTMKTLAAAIELDQKELYDVKVPLRDGTVTSIGELKNQHQDNITKIEGYEARIKEMEAGVGQQSIQQQLSEAEMMARVEMAKIQDEYNNTDWADLDEFDAGKSALLRQQLGDKYSQAQNILNQANQQRSIDQQSFIDVQRKKMYEIIPEWKDEAIERADKDGMSKIMIEAGYTENEVSQSSDPIAFLLLRELMILRKEKEESTKLVKRVRKAPKAIKGMKPAPITSTQIADKYVAKAKKSGRRDDLLNATKAKLMSLGVKS